LGGSSLGAARHLLGGSSFHYGDASGWWRGDGEEPLGFVEEEVREHEGFVADVLPAETA